MSAVAIFENLPKKKNIDIRPVFLLQNSECISQLGEYPQQVTNVSAIKLKLMQNILEFLLLKNLNDTLFFEPVPPIREKSLELQSLPPPWYTDLFFLGCCKEKFCRYNS